jgi:hypothetical protein
MKQIEVQLSLKNLMSKDTLYLLVRYSIVLQFMRKEMNNWDHRILIKTRVLKNKEFSPLHIIIWKIHHHKRKQPLLGHPPQKSQIFKSSNTISVQLEIASLLKHTMSQQISKFPQDLRLNLKGWLPVAHLQSRKLLAFLFQPVQVQLRLLLLVKTNSEILS